eukprot:TRINITY_DN2055_c0_g1_i2.p1 TRINITY_DN2055_c0_g1~~TRINITY_DN2055_c0_g1_i2.p1  ORF type:complete len:472 (-),score=27.49 TRINITY_DN2055_c0_g1_i2:337-1752(-)
METSEYGSIQILFNLESYLPGDTLIGRVLLDVKQAYPGQAVVLEIRGKERVRAEGPPQINEKAYLIKEQTTLHEITNNLVFPTGQYEFPFSFRIPEESPATTDAEGLAIGISVARVTYYVRAYIKSTDPSAKPLKSRRHFLVREIIHAAPAPNTGYIRADILKCFCLKGDNTRAQFQLDKDYYSAGETAQFNIEVNNTNSSLPVRGIAIELICNVRVGDRSQQTVSVTVPISSSSLPGFPARQGVDSDESRRLTHFNLKRKDGRPLPATTWGQILTIQYHVRVSLEIEQNALFKPSNTTGDLELVLHTSHKQGEAASLRQGWSPKVFDILKIAVTSLAHLKHAPSTTTDETYQYQRQVVIFSSPRTCSNKQFTICDQVYILVHLQHARVSSYETPSIYDQVKVCFPLVSFHSTRPNQPCHVVSCNIPVLSWNGLGPLHTQRRVLEQPPNPYLYKNNSGSQNNPLCPFQQVS